MIKKLLKSHNFFKLTYITSGGGRMTTHGIDVSQYQGLIDWEVVKDRIDFAIIRCGYGQDRTDQDDKLFTRNADECTRLKIPFGVYLYSYAKSPSDAIKEANHVLRLVKNYQMAYPIYYDLEDNNTTGRQSNAVIGDIAKTFADKMEKEGYYVGIYASLYWWKTKLTSSIFDQYTRWVANYASELNYDRNYDMWQYSSTGWVEGVPTIVDLDYCYADFPAIIKRAGKNNFDKDPNSINEYQVGDTVRFNYVFLTSESSNPLRPYRNIGTITKIEAGARNPYLIGNDQGWVNDTVIEGKINYLSNPDYVGDSLVGALQQIDVDTSFQNRLCLARLNGITNYVGSAAQNLQLLQLLKEGKLIS